MSVVSKTFQKLKTLQRLYLFILILATMPFLITYAAIEYSYFALCQQFEINQRRLQNYKVQGPQSPTFDKTQQNGKVENKVQRSDASHDIFKGDTEILYIETP